MSEGEGQSDQSRGPALPPENSPTVLDRVAAAIRVSHQHEAVTRIGPYRLLQVIGEGGMGVVYEAVQEGLGLQVALKVVRPGCMTADMRRRFEYEASLLARLQHPGIARIHYAGIFDAGQGPQPYFAMELIAGTKLDDYLKQNRARLKLRQLVELFHEICVAVQHAHSRFVVHRDLKPSNILITSDGKPRILDFGVARALDSDLRATQHTDLGQLVGTLPYMSPEQAAGRVSEIDTSSDVYALGVIGYEILGGRMPYLLQGKALHEAVRVICDEEPSRLSSIDRSLRGDVETIVQKALEKDKTRRYHTAGELASDVKRFLDYEPITARPLGTWYQLGRFAGRNKALVGGFIGILLALATGAAVSTYFAINASRQRAEAEQGRAEADAVSQFLVADVLSGASPSQLPDKAVRDVIVKKLIEPAASRVGARFKDNPLVEAAVRNTLALNYDALGHAETGITQAITAHQLRRDLLGDDHPDTLSSKINLSRLYQSLGKFNEAEPINRDALARSRRTLGQDHPTTLYAINCLAALRQLQGDLPESLELHRQALDLSRKLHGEESAEALTSLDNVGTVLAQQGKLPEATVLCSEALAKRRRVLGPDHLETLLSMNNLGYMMLQQGKLEDARPLLQEALSRERSVLGDDHPYSMAAMHNMAYLHELEGRYAESETLLREALDRRRRILGHEHLDTLRSMANMANVLRLESKLAEAEPLQRTTLEQFRRLLGHDHLDTLTVINNMAAVLYLKGEHSQAEPLYREAVERFQRTLGKDHPTCLRTMVGLAVALRRQDKFEEAESVCREALTGLNRVLGADHQDTLSAVNCLGELLGAQGRFDEAEPLWREALETCRRVLGDSHPNTLNAMNSMGIALFKQGKQAEAEPYWREALEGMRRVMGEDHWLTMTSKHNLGRLLEAQGRLAEAETLFAELYRRAVAVQMDPAIAALHVSQYGPVLVRLGRHEEARMPLEEAYRRLKATRQERRPQFKIAVSGLIDVTDATTHPEDAAKWRAELAALEAATRPSTSPTTAAN